MPNMNLKKLWKKKSVTITEYDPTYKVVYLGNVLTGWAKGEGCVDKPLATLWRNYCQSNRQDIAMKVTICSAGLRAVTQEHGLTEYWAHRVTYCVAHPSYPRVFCWVYRHEGRRLKQELRCHAVLCPKNTKAEAMAAQLRVRLASALQEFRREKVVRQNARLSLMHAIYDSASIPRRKLLLSTGGANYRPPLERSKSAPKLGAIEETIEEEDEEGLGNSDEEEIDEIEAASVHLQPEEDVGGSSTMSETTSDIVVDYDSSSEVASAGQDQYVLEEEYEGPHFASPCHHSDSLLYCPVPPLSPLDDRPQHHLHHHHQPLGVVEEAGDDEGTCEDASSVPTTDNLGLLATLTRELSLAPPAEESLTSDQPESLGSHCDSCSSSCGACSDPCDVTTEQENLMNQSDHRINESRLITEGDNPVKMARMEGDNISEESGYSEDKDSLQNLDATKL
ncbi:protein FAM43A-like [Homarus americanus]|uniref:protein FAM43A-like n=1 Tax=Homarus americanus TaxID=6706 RepID=UPI001C446567|nr:protein FAM43A-like [Homarus americanus]